MVTSLVWKGKIPDNVILTCTLEQFFIVYFDLNQKPQLKS